VLRAQGRPGRSAGRVLSSASALAEFPVTTPCQTHKLLGWGRRRDLGEADWRQFGDVGKSSALVWLVFHTTSVSADDGIEKDLWVNRQHQSACLKRDAKHELILGAGNAARPANAVKRPLLESEVETEVERFILWLGREAVRRLGWPPFADGEQTGRAETAQAGRSM
jgi:hypothetical protein